MSHKAILLPGGVLPAQPAYAALLSALGNDVDAHAKDLEVYAEAAPPSDYSLDVEVDGIARYADRLGFEKFHLVGYSGGGAASLAFVCAHPERVSSLTLMEPAWAGNEGLSAEELAVRQIFRRLEGLPPPEFMAGFVRAQLREGVSPPPSPEGPTPPWMAKRPGGLNALAKAFSRAKLDLRRLRAFQRPVLYLLGGLSNPDYFARMADRLATVFPDFSIETYADRHHFDPPHRVEPERVATMLRGFWKRAETAP